MAPEEAKLASAGIKAQAAITALTQANSKPQNLLSLLKSQGDPPYPHGRFMSSGWNGEPFRPRPCSRDDTDMSLPHFRQGRKKHRLIGPDDPFQP